MAFRAGVSNCWLTSQFFQKAKKDADAAVETRYVVSELSAKAGKPFTKGQFLKDCILEVAEIVSPEKKSLFRNLSLLATEVAKQNSKLSSDIKFSLHTLWRLTKAYTKPPMLN